MYELSYVPPFETSTPVKIKQRFNKLPCLLLKEFLYVLLLSVTMVADLTATNLESQLLNMNKS